MQMERISGSRQLELLLMIFRNTVNDDVRAIISSATPIDRVEPHRHHWREALADVHYIAGLARLLREDLGKASKNFETAAELYDIVDEKERYAVALLAEGIAQWQPARNTKQPGKRRESDKYYQAFELCRKAEKFCQTIAWPEGYAAALEILGAFYRRAGDLVSALDAYDTCRTIREAGSDNRGSAEAAMAIGTIHETLEQFDTALSYLADALVMFGACGDRFGEVAVLTHLASIYCSCDRRHEARDHALRALMIYDALGERLKAADVMLTIARIYEKDEDLDVALDFAMKVIATLDFATHLDIIADTPAGEADVDTLMIYQLRASALMHIGGLYRRMRKYSEARFYLENALVIAQNIGDRTLQYLLHEELTRVWSGMNDFKKALEHHRYFAQIRKDVAGEERQREIAALQVRFDIDKAERDRRKVEEIEREMRRKEDDLAMMAADLQKKGEFLKRLETLARELQGDRGKRTRAIAEQILEEIKNSRVSDQTRILFENQRNLLHRDFMSRLSVKHPRLTKRQLIVCSVIRLNLDLTAQGLAELLHITPRTVETHKCDIRKALGLGPDNDLGTYLTGI